MKSTFRVGSFEVSYATPTRYRHRETVENGYEKFPNDDHPTEVEWHVVSVHTIFESWDEPGGL